MNKSLVIVASALAPLLVLLALIVGLILLLTTSAAACNPTSGGSGTAVSVDPKSVPKGPIAGYAGEQLVNAATIMVAIKDLNMSKRDQQLAVMTAMGESSLKVLDYGDNAGPDSRGLFQQRDNGAWGTYEQRMDPYQSAQMFGKALKGITDRDSLQPTIAVHRVQRNSDPYYYTPFWEPAGQVVAGLTGIRSSSPSIAPVGNQRQSTHYELGPVAPATQTVADTLGPMFDIEEIGGYRTGGDCQDHCRGLALDFMTYQDSAKGQRLADYLVENHEALYVKYIVWQQQIINFSSDYFINAGWRDMASRGNPTDNHMDHVHLSLLDEAQPINGAPAAQCDGPVIGADGWTKPVPGEIDNDYGMRFHPILHINRMHWGIDVGNGCDDDILAVNSGTVTYAGPSGGFGNLIEIDHGEGVHSRYAHMHTSGILVRAGDAVQSGQHIGEIGSAGLSTACHLHFEMTVDGEHVNPYEFLMARITT